MAKENSPIIIKKYANRRLYNTDTSAYITLEDLACIVKKGDDFIVYDAKSGEDITRSVLTQIIFEQEGKNGQSLLPISFLRQLIRFYGDSMGRLVPSYLDMSIETLAREQERFRKQMAETWGSAAGGGPFASVPFGAAPFGAAALEAMQEQTRHNLALFEKAMSLWSPFTAASRGPGAHVSNGNGDAGKVPAPTVRSSEPTPTKDDGDLAAMREQLAAMQRQLDRLSRGE